MNRRRSTNALTTFRIYSWAFFIFVAWVSAAPARQDKAGESDQKLVLRAPTPNRVYQRDQAGFGEIKLDLVNKEKYKNIQVIVMGGEGFDTVIEEAEFGDGVLRGIPTGGPYLINIRADEDSVEVDPIYVGDVWILAGQSNMEGVADLIDVTPPNPKVMLLGMDGKWDEAKEPLHWLVDSPDPVHSGDPANRAERSKRMHANRRKGAGLGLPFGVAMTEALGVPIGLVACAHGGTSMEQWSPAKKGEEGKSLYGSMLRQFELAGGKARGVLWYQGESDANPNAAPKYAKVMEEFIAAVRSDFHDPDLPFYLVQIGRVVRGGDPKDWNMVQDAERLIPEKIAHTAVASVIDLELDDGIHVGTHGHKRLGKRLANLALRNLFGHVGATTPTFESVSRGAHNRLIVKFRDVNFSQEDTRLRGLQPTRHIAGFSLRKADGSEIPLIFDASVGPAPDTVVLKLNGRLPEGAFLWYGWGFDPYCNLVDAWDAAVPVFGPIALDPAK